MGIEKYWRKYEKQNPVNRVNEREKEKKKTKTVEHSIYNIILINFRAQLVCRTRLKFRYYDYTIHLSYTARKTKKFSHARIRTAVQ
jgi:hypothetical protein